jgi:hypothetical protein
VYGGGVSVLRRLIVAVCALAMLTASLAVTGAGAHSTGPAGATASKKKCPKGKKLVTVTKHGKKTKVCKKKKATPAPPPCRLATSSCAIPAPTGVFEAPGKTLEGEAAKPFLTKYLLNSTFTDCPTGWPSCGGFEDRYSHTTDSTFYQCLLRPTSGSDVKSVGEYGVDNARIEADGSWTFHERIGWYGYVSSFEWHVAANGVVEGAYQSHENVGTPEKLGPLQYVSGARDCSY